LNFFKNLIKLTVVIYKKRSEVDHELGDRDAADHENLCAEFLPITTTLRIINVRRRSKAVQVTHSLQVPPVGL
jgi:hypothetical protein